MARRCLDCGALSPASRCPTCAAARKAERAAGRPAAAAAVAAHRARHGDWCPGYRRPPHASADLTAEHTVPISRGGVIDAVLCRSCNSRKRDR